MRKISSAIVIAAILMATPVSAGEIGGNGQYVPGGDNGASLCSYSGLNDSPNDIFGFIQSFGWVMRKLGIMPRFFNPGDRCRGN